MPHCFSASRQMTLRIPAMASSDQRCSCQPGAGRYEYSSPTFRAARNGTPSFAMCPRPLHGKNRLPEARKWNQTFAFPSLFHLRWHKTATDQALEVALSKKNAPAELDVSDLLLQDPASHRVRLNVQKLGRFLNVQQLFFS